MFNLLLVLTRRDESSVTGKIATVTFVLYHLLPSYPVCFSCHRLVNNMSAAKVITSVNAISVLQGNYLEATIETDQK